VYGPGERRGKGIERGKRAQGKEGGEGGKCLSTCLGVGGQGGTRVRG